MVKGISRQVIVVQSPDQKLFEQAIFILKDDAVGKDGITDEMLLKTADKLFHSSERSNKPGFVRYGSFWALVGAMAIGLAWLVTALI
jgi:hypothetical protein